MTTSRFCSHCGADNTPNDALCHACQQPLDAVQEATTLLNERYAILAEIGAGGFGAVYQARDTQEQNRLVAVKQINLKGLSPQEIIEATDAFNREAQLLSALRHPLLPRIFDRFSDAEHWYLVMTFIDGSTLDEYLQQHTVRALPARAGLSLDETLRIGLQLCEVLAYLHTQYPPVIFRDIKPGNIMRTASGRLYLIDFGIARHFKPGQAKDTIPFGSPGFAAPEQYGRSQTTPQADIYSLGALLYCLISGDDPADHPFQFPPLRLYGIDGISDLDALIQRMVTLAPEQRPANILEVHDELLAIQHIHAQANKQHIWTPPQGQTPDASTFGQQHIFSSVSSSNPLSARKTTRRRVVTAGLAVGGVAIVGSIASGLIRHNSSFNLDPAVATATAKNAEATYTAEAKQLAVVPTNELTYWSPDLSHVAAINTDQKRLELYTTQDKQLLYAIKPSADFSSTNPFEYTIQWSSDNNKIMFIPDGGVTLIWDVQKRQQIFTLSQSSYDFTATAWSPTGEILAIGYADDGNADIVYTNFALLRASDGTQLFHTTFPGQQIVDCIAWSPDSKYFLLPDKNFNDAGYSGLWSAKIWNSHTYQPVDSLKISIPAHQITSSTNPPIFICWPTSNTKIAIAIGYSIWIYSLGKEKATYKFADITYDVFNYGPIWSPDEKFLAMILNGSLTILDVSSRQPVQRKSTNLQGYLLAFAWSADSKSITAVDYDNVISHWSVG